MNTNPVVQANPVTLNGLEAFLETNHAVEEQQPVVSSPVPVPDLELQKTTVYYETRTLLELLGQVQKVHDLLSDANKRLTSAYARVEHMEQVIEAQDKKLEVIPELQRQAERAVELQRRLDVALSDLEKLRQPWWHRLSNNGIHKI